MNFNYHIYVSNIKCPYCNKDCDDYDYEVAQNLEEKVEFECEHCGKRFYVEAIITYCTYSDCELNDEPHDWEQSVSHPTVFDCRNCYQHKVENSEVK